MKTIGLLGGMSWESTAEYYRIINQQVAARLGGLNSARLVLYSLNFAEVEKLQQKGDWESATSMMIAGAKRVEAAGAECLLICTNTMHKMADAVAEAISIPLLHIADTTAWRIKAAGLNRVGLLGTRFTMEGEFYRGRLIDQHGLEVITPDAEQRATVHDIIYSELCKGLIREESQQQYLQIVESLFAKGAEAVILGCTEIGMLIDSRNTEIPLFDTAQIHAEAAIDFALR